MIFLGFLRNVFNENFVELVLNLNSFNPWCLIINSVSRKVIGFDLRSKILTTNQIARFLESRSEVTVKYPLSVCPEVFSETASRYFIIF